MSTGASARSGQWYGQCTLSRVWLPRLDDGIAHDGAFVLQLVILERKLDDACEHPFPLPALRLDELTHEKGTSSLRLRLLQLVLMYLLGAGIRLTLGRVELT